MEVYRSDFVIMPRGDRPHGLIKALGIPPDLCVQEHMIHRWFPLCSARAARACPSGLSGDRIALRGRPGQSAGQRRGTVPKRERRPGPATGGQHMARSAQGSGMLERIVDGEAFGSGRCQQRVIGRDKQGWWHPPLVQQALHRQGAGQLHGVIGP
jgi:hypothetical protein